MTGRRSIPYRADLDGLRGVAVLLVILHHAFPAALPAGFVGVDVFFVLSGYLITGIVRADLSVAGARRLAVLGAFYARRVRRIFPSLLVVLATCLALGAGFVLPASFAELAQHAAASAGFCLNLVLASQVGYFASDALQRPLLHLWSLGIEEQFYLVWPLLLIALATRRERLVPLTVFLAALSFFANVTKPEATAAIAFYLPHLRGWELLLGAVLALARPDAAANDAGGRRVREFLSGAGGALLVAGLVFIKPAASFPDWRGLLPTLGTVCLIGAGPDGHFNRFLANRVLVGLGLISYPLYLWHWPLLVFAPTLLPGVGYAPSVAVALALPLAWLTHRFVENPLRHGDGGRRKVLVLVGGMAALAAMAGAIRRGAGFPNRFPPFIRDVSAQAVVDHGRDWRRGVGYLDFGQDESCFARDPTPMLPQRRTLYLWGDSHAAQLYPGCAERWGTTHNLVQRTAAAVPPLLTTGKSGRSDAAEITAFVLDELARLRPDTVMLAALWTRSEWRELEATVARLRELGIRHIVVIGPVPEWERGLPQQLMNYHLWHRFAPVPARLPSGWEQKPLEVDAAMAAFCRALGVDYVSPLRVLGNADGYLVRLGDTADTITSFDYGHLTPAASRYVVARFPAID